MKPRNWYHRNLGWVPRPVRQVIIMVIGGTMLLLGLIMFIPLVPGPGFLLIPIGLAILALEFAWAARWLLKIRRATYNMQQRMWGEHAPWPAPWLLWCRQSISNVWHKCRVLIKRPKSQHPTNGS